MKTETKHTDLTKFFRGNPIIDKIGRRKATVTVVGHFNQADQYNLPIGFCVLKRVYNPEQKHTVVELVLRGFVPPLL